MYRQVKAFLDSYSSIEENEVVSNDMLVNDLSDKNIERLFCMVEGVLEDEEANFITLLIACIP